MDDSTDWTRRVTAFLITSGEPSTAECRACLGAQDVRVRVDVIDHVAPMDRAFQAMLDRCETELYVQVDADMLLHPDAVRRLVEGIDAQDRHVASWCGWLWCDAEEMSLTGVKVYRHAITRRYPYRPALSCEIGPMEAMKRDGFTAGLMLPRPMDRARCLGLHTVLQSPEVAFHRFERLAQKFRQREYLAWASSRFGLLRRRFLDHHAAGNVRAAEAYEAAWLGSVAGLTGPLAEGTEMDSTAPRDDWRRVRAMLGDWSTGPRELTLYVSGRCNARCTFCLRSHDPTLDRPEAMIAADVALVLDRLPTVTGVCVAGFGETLLAPDIDGIARLLQARAVPYSIITNGILLRDHVAELADAQPGRLVVSLNAATAGEHERLHRVQAWDRILDGIRQAVAAGLPVELSFITGRSAVDGIPARLALARELGVRSVVIANLLPYTGTDDPDFRREVIRATDTETLAKIEAAKGLPGAELVGHWPVPIDPEGRCPRRCTAPFISVGVDVKGWTTFCRRGHPPRPGGVAYHDPALWHSPEVVGMRRQLTGDAPMRPECSWCFGNWWQ